MAKFPDTHALQEARQHFQAGRVGDAEAACKAALKGDRRNAAAWHLLGRISYLRADEAQAISHFDKCTRAEPGNPGYLGDFARMLAASGRLKEAISKYDRALKIDRRYRPALSGKAAALDRLGRTDDARRLLAAFIEADDADAEMALVYATLEQQAGNHEAAVAIGRTYIDRADAPPTVRRHLGFMIGKSLDRLGDSAAAFDAFRRANEQANDLGVGAGRFNRSAHEARVDRLIEVFQPERLRLMARATRRSEMPVLVTGMPRSGTTLVEQIIHAHPQAHGAGELSDLDRLVKTIASDMQAEHPYPDCMTELTPAAADRLSRPYLDHLRRLGRGARRVVDKNIGTFHHLGLVSVLLPGARVIHCVRDPMDVCLSCYMSPLSPVLHPWASDLGDIGAYHRQYERMMAHWRESLDLPILDVRYEEVVAAQDDWSRRIIGFCDLDWSDACARFHEADRPVRTLSYDQVRQPIYTRAVGRYRQYEAFLEPLRAALEKAES